MPYDAIVIGAGHNGLVAACYLARAGRKVCVFERRHLVGGACVTEEVVPGFKFSRLAYVNSLFRPRIIEELKLGRHGFELLPRDPSSFTPFPDGRSLLLGPDQSASCREIAKFSARDAEAYPRYEAELETLARFLEPLLDRPPARLLSSRPGDWMELASLLWRARRLGPRLYRLLSMLAGSARELLDEWFESDSLKATLATDAIIGAMAGPSDPGTAYVLFHHVMGESNGARGVWAYVRGGMGALSEALAAAARSLGVEIRTECAVQSICVNAGRAQGVVTESGEEVRARAVLSSVDPRLTFLHLVDRSALDDAFLRRIEALDFSSAVFKLNLALSELPAFTALGSSQPGPPHRGTIHISPTVDWIDKAYLDARGGVPSRAPVLECTIPSVLDPSLAPPGQHVMGMFVQYAPYGLAEGTWDEIKEDFADRCIELLEEYAPGFQRLVIARDAISPLDLERDFALTGGNIFHGAMTPGQLYFLRPAPLWSGYTTPVRGLFLCGAGAHPGGGVMGACGRNAAEVVLKTRR